MVINGFSSIRRLSLAAATLAAAASLGLAGAASADVLVNVNFSSHWSTGGEIAPAGTPGALTSGTMDWNNVQANTNAGSGNYSGGASNLVDTNGNTTSMGVTVSPLKGGYNGNPNQESGTNVMLYNYMSGGMTQAAPAVVTFTGLDATGATSYSVYVYNWYSWAAGSATTAVTEAGGTLPAAQTNTFTGNFSTEGTTFTSGVNYVLFTGLKANAAGDLQLSGYGDAGFNGVQLDAASALVPEPSTVKLALLGVLGMGLLLKKRKMA